MPPVQASVMSSSVTGTKSVPSHISVHIKPVAIGTSSIQSKVSSIGGAINSGGSVSTKVIVCICVITSPQMVRYSQFLTI